MSVRRVSKNTWRLHVGFLNTGHSDGKPLQLSSRKLPNFTFKNLRELQPFTDCVEVIELELILQHLVNGHFALDGTRNVVDVLRLDQCLQVILQDLGEVVLQLGSTEVLQNLLPVWGVLKVVVSTGAIGDRTRRALHRSGPSLALAFRLKS